MNSLALFQQSNAWDARYGLPLCPGLDNPWLYGAYALKLMRENGLSAFDDLKLVEKFREYADECRIEPGLFNRWPGKTDDTTSHDELMGMAYISTELAQEVLGYLERNDGVYTNNPDDSKNFPDWPYRFNVYRMVWLKPFLRARAGDRLNIFSQLPFAGHLALDAWKTTKDNGLADQGGRLRIWIMLEAMEHFPITGAATVIWRDRMNRLGFSPRAMLEREPRECPLYYSLGRKEF